jgi:CDP-glycerol glycerophosphotransferase
MPDRDRPLKSAVVPLISVIIPIHDVEPYLHECLESVAGQTVRDLEVIMVDDGSADRSAAIAEEFAARDERFRLVSQPNGGLGRARNTGLDEAHGEFLSFVDSDDVLPANAYQLLLRSLKKTGSDFATGNVHRLTRTGTRQALFLARAFREPLPKTHVTRFPALLSDRIVPNKLWRRSFWDAQGFRFPEGILHEDIPVVVPAQFLARSVDVIADPVYYYRVRQQGALSITQRRLEPHALLSRVDAVGRASDHLGRHSSRKAKRWYDQTVVADDLRYFLNVLDRADDDYRSLFLDRVNAFLDRASRGAFDELPAIERLKWHLVRRRLMPELLEVIRFQKEDLGKAAPVRVGRRWYGDYPFRTDPKLRIPDSVYRLERELTLRARIEDLSWEGGELKIRGHAHVRGICAPSADSQEVTVSMIRPGRLRRVRLMASAVRWKTSSERRPDVRAATGQPWCDPGWSGFVATLEPRKLRTLGRWREGTWEVYVTVRASGVKRRRSQFRPDSPRPVRALDVPLSPDLRLRMTPTEDDRIVVQLGSCAAIIHGHRLTDGAIELSGELSDPAGGGLKLRLTSRNGSGAIEYPVSVPDEARAGFRVALPLADLRARAEADGHPSRREQEHDGKVFALHLVGSGQRLRVAMEVDVEEGIWSVASQELALYRNRRGEAELALRAPHAVVDDVRWSEDGTLHLGGHLRSLGGSHEVVLIGRRSRERHVFPLRHDAEAGRFDTAVTAAGVESLGGPRPLSADGWELFVRPSEGDAMMPVLVSQVLYGRLPLAKAVRHKLFTLGTTPEDGALLVAKRDLDEDEAGPFNQRRLQEVEYARRRTEPLRDAVVYSSFGGRQYSDSPRAIHEELVRRNAPLEHLWVVRDGMCNPPASGEVIREGSRAFHEAFARARFIVTNDHFPEWFTRRHDQVCLQTWHGAPLKRLGLDMQELRRQPGRVRRPWSEEVANWQYFVSPNRFSTPILRRAYGIEGEVLETGYPRDDILSHPHRKQLARELRQRLALPDEVRVVLYAPTYRDNIIERRGVYRLDLHLDFEQLRRSLGDDTVVLFRKHHYVADAVPDTAHGFVRDVSSYPDCTELLLAADVLVTDYSSVMFDYANTGRPMLFFTYDLETYSDDIRGFYFDFMEKAPGPLLGTTSELADALNDIEAVRTEFGGRYAEFVSTFCELDDGYAAARVVERVFSW